MAGDTETEEAGMEATEIAVGVSLGDEGRYRLRRLVGTGGMASVWLATDSRLERNVAIKVLADVLALDAEYVSRFAREARVAAGLSHPHLVRLYDFSAHGTRPFLVMEYVAGGTLADRLRTEQARSGDPVVLAYELLDAIGYIHAAGVIHRDIKPANVLIGTDGRARLTDFGIAQPSGATRATLTGQVIGSRSYMAPELYSGGRADERSDLYALGVLLGECMTSDSASQLRALVGLLTAEDPRQRPASAREALAVLERSPTARMRVLPRRPATARTATARTRLRSGRTFRSERWITRDGREINVHVSRAAAVRIVAFAALLVALLILATSGGGGTATSLRSPPARAPLGQQLGALNQAISHARR